MGRTVSCLILSLVLCMMPCAAQITFGDIDINGSDSLLFSVSQGMPGSGICKSLFLAHLGQKSPDAAPRILTCWPERLESLNGGRILQIRNRLGTARYTRTSTSIKNASLKWISWNGVDDGLSCSVARTGASSVSPDGNWLCFVQKSTVAAGQLILQNVLTGEQMVLAEDSPFSYDEVRVKWSPDSSFVIYEKQGTLFFVNPSLSFRQVNLSEEYRKIGSGSIRNVAWAENKSLIYIDGDIVYRILENELYIRGLYSYFIGSGSIAGRLLIPFDGGKDTFWCNASGTRLAVCTDGKFVSYSSLNKEAYDFVQPHAQFSFSRVNGSVTDSLVFWTGDGRAFIWVSYIPYSGGREKGAVFELSADAPLVFDQTEPVRPLFSPDRSRIVFADMQSVFVYNIRTWEKIAELGGEKTVSVAWASSGSIYVGGSDTVRLWSFSDTMSISSVLFLSAVNQAYWDAGKIVAFASADTTGAARQPYVYDVTRNCWNTYDKDISSLVRSERNDNFRVFAADSKSRLYTNALFVRNLSDGAYTYPLYADTQNVLAPQKKIALVFDAVDSTDGLSRILSSMQKFNVTGTFFINGEFMRRYPLETKQIADSGCVCASSFFSNVDLLSRDYRIDADFIRRGLARNEDEFYAVTGKEFSLLWHAPFYHADEMVLAAGKESGYRYVDASSCYFDRSLLDVFETSDSMDSCITMLSDGMILSFSVGNSGRDGLYDDFDLFLAALLDRDYQIVSLETLLPE